MFCSQDNVIDYQLNKKFLHPKPVYSKQNLIGYYEQIGIDFEHLPYIKGIDRYIIENGDKPNGKTLQGSIYNAIDILTGRRVVIKIAKKNLVEKHLCSNGNYVCEDIRSEAKLLWNISKHKNADCGFSKFVEFFENKENYCLVMEHCGIELLGYIRSVHPFKENNYSLTQEWKQYIQYHFRFIAKCINFLHNECGMAHLDLSLENTVIDESICRIIDFGLAIQCGKNVNQKNLKSWKHGEYVGKKLYQSPEIRRIGKYVIKGENVPIDKMYNPQSADIWALGVILFIMLVGSQPWHTADDCDSTFNLIYYHENGMEYVLNQWKSLDYVDPIAMDLLKKIFVCESNRIDINGIMNHEYVKNAPRSLGNDNGNGNGNGNDKDNCNDNDKRDNESKSKETATRDVKTQTEIENNELSENRSKMKSKDHRQSKSKCNLTDIESPLSDVSESVNSPCNSPTSPSFNTVVSATSSSLSLLSLSCNDSTKNLKI